MANLSGIVGTGTLAANGGTETFTVNATADAIGTGLVNEVLITGVGPSGVPFSGNANATFAINQSNQPPDCSNARPSVDTLWPPNHKFVAIDINGVTDPDGDPITITIDKIYQDEPVDTNGDGSFVPDGKGIGTSTAEVRAERSGTPKVPGNGRVYHISFTAKDEFGGVCNGEILVKVPHDQKKPVVDGGALYDSTVSIKSAELTNATESTDYRYQPQ